MQQLCIYIVVRAVSSTCTLHNKSLFAFKLKVRSCAFFIVKIVELAFYHFSSTSIIIYKTNETLFFHAKSSDRFYEFLFYGKIIIFINYRFAQIYATLIVIFYAIKMIKWKIRLFNTENTWEALSYIDSISRTIDILNCSSTPHSDKNRQIESQLKRHKLIWWMLFVPCNFPGSKQCDLEPHTRQTYAECKFSYVW